ncbi:MAG: metallophosphoesterase [Promethearchaeota archaeon]
MNNIEYNNKTTVLIVSDTHLGASGAKYDDFNNFLNLIYSKKEEGKLELLKCLIVAGDFFDLCMDSYRDLSKEKINLEIYDNLIKLQDKGIQIVITLGNHEIPTTWCHDRLFKSRKKTFIDEFTKQFNTSGRYLEFFKKIKFCQYCILYTNNDSKLEINLYDRKKNLAKNKISKNVVKLDILSDMDTKQKFLFSHGYQFERWYLHFFASFVWATSINSPDIIKELNNFLYNDLYKEAEKFSKEQIEEALETPSTAEFIKTRDIKVEKINRKKLRKLMNKNRKTNLRREKIKDKNKRYFKKAFKFLEKEKYSHISHVIFGHTHQEDQQQKNNKYVLNAGAWQNVKHGHYIEILVDGKVIPKNYE